MEIVVWISPNPSASQVFLAIFKAHTSRKKRKTTKNQVWEALKHPIPGGLRLANWEATTNVFRVGFQGTVGKKKKGGKSKLCQAEREPREKHNGAVSGRDLGRDRWVQSPCGGRRQS